MRKHFSIFALLLCSFASLLGQAEKGSVVEVVIGKAEYKSGDQVLPVTKGISIKDGDTIVTGLGQMVILRLENGGQLVVYEKSEMTMKSKEGDAAKSILDLDTGFLWVRVPKLKKDSSFSVDMPGASAGIQRDCLQRLRYGEKGKPSLRLRRRSEGDQPQGRGSNFETRPTAQGRFQRAHGKTGTRPKVSQASRKKYLNLPKLPPRRLFAGRTLLETSTCTSRQLCCFDKNNLHR